MRRSLGDQTNLGANLRAGEPNRRGNTTECVTDVIPPDMLNAAGAPGDIITLTLLRARDARILTRSLRQVVAGRSGGNSRTPATDEYRHTESGPHPSLPVMPTTHT